jgi:hypothetical protein
MSMLYLKKFILKVDFIGKIVFCVFLAMSVEQSFADNFNSGVTTDDVDIASPKTPKPILLKPIKIDGAIAPGSGPYLQNVTTTSIVVCWIMNEQVQTHLLNNLEPGQDYTYTLSDNTKDYIVKFRTAPKVDQSFNFAVWGDNRSYPGIAKAVAEQMLKKNPNMAINTGDIAHRGDSINVYINEFFQPFANLFSNVPFFVSVGNHEYVGDSKLVLFKKLLRQPGNGLYFAFTYGNSRFIVLNSYETRELNKGGKQLKWLETEFNSDDYKKSKFKFLIFHHAPYSQDWYGGTVLTKQTRGPAFRYIIHLAEKNGVDIVFCGHFHCYDRGMKTSNNGHETYFIVTGGGGGPNTLTNKNLCWPFMTVHGHDKHFTFTEIDGSNLSFQAIDTDGNIIDQFEIHKKKEEYL